MFKVYQEKWYKEEHNKLFQTLLIKKKKRQINLWV